STCWREEPKLACEQKSRRLAYRRGYRFSVSTSSLLQACLVEVRIVLSGLRLPPCCAQLLHNVAHECLGIAEQHERVVHVVERIVDAGEARIHTALDHHDCVSFLYI